jgi:hypothetical protein
MILSFSVLGNMIMPKKPKWVSQNFSSLPELSVDSFYKVVYVEGYDLNSTRRSGKREIKNYVDIDLPIKISSEANDTMQQITINTKDEFRASFNERINTSQNGTIKQQYSLEEEYVKKDKNNGKEIWLIWQLYIVEKF